MPNPELTDRNVPNLHEMKATQSLKSQGYMKEQFAWRHFYWYLANDGFQHLRDDLHQPLESVPATMSCSGPEIGRPQHQGPEGERQQGSQEGKQIDTPTGVLCPLVLTRKLRLGLAQQLNSSLEAASVMDVVSHLSENGDCVVLNKF